MEASPDETVSPRRLPPLAPCRLPDPRGNAGRHRHAGHAVYGAAPPPPIAVRWPRRPEQRRSSAARWTARILHIWPPASTCRKIAEGLGWHPLAALALKVSNDAAAMGARRELAAEMGRRAIKVYPDRWAEVLTGRHRASMLPPCFSCRRRSQYDRHDVSAHRGQFQGATGVFAVSISDAAATIRNLAREHGVHQLPLLLLPRPGGVIR